MKKKNYLPYFTGIFCALFVFQIQGCESLKVDYYNGERALYFERERLVEASYVRQDTVNLNLTYYLDAKEVSHPFKVLLIGNLLTEDLEYTVVRVDSLSTAKEDMVTLPDRLLFRKGVAADSLWVTIHKDKVEAGGEYYVTYQLAANENFNVGYTGYTTVRVAFSNKESKPLWWDSGVELVFLGEWSQEKFDALVRATGIISFEGLSATEMRQYALQLKEYIEENQLSMTVPVY